MADVHEMLVIDLNAAIQRDGKNWRRTALVAVSAPVEHDGRCQDGAWCPTWETIRGAYDI